MAPKNAKRRKANCSHTSFFGSESHSEELNQCVIKVLAARGNGEQKLHDGFECLTCGITAPSIQELKDAHPGRKGINGHELAIDLNFGEVYCLPCADYVYLPDLDSAITKVLLASRTKLQPSSPDNQTIKEEQQLTDADAAQNPSLDGNAITQQQQQLEGMVVDLVSNNPEQQQQQLDDPCSVAPTVSAPFLPPQPSQQGLCRTQPPPPQQQPPDLLGTVHLQDTFPAGLRGLNNMGHTCFMNSVLQVMLQSPLLASHYLMHGHCRQDCSISSDAGYCVSCELDAVCSAAHSGCRTPHSPAPFLHAWWMLAGSLLGRYQQQDAHEFFLFILEMLSAAATRPEENVTARIFTGKLRSDVYCGCCGHVSTTIDPFTNLSLDIPAPQLMMPPPIVPRPVAGSKAGGIASGAGAHKSQKPSAASGKNNSKGGKTTPPKAGKAAGGGKKGNNALNTSAAAGAGSGAVPIVKGGTKLVGAALSSHLAKLRRKANSSASAAVVDVDGTTAVQQDGGGGGGSGSDPTGNVTMEDSLSQDPSASGGDQGTTRPSPPLSYVGARSPPGVGDVLLGLGAPALVGGARDSGLDQEQTSIVGIGGGINKEGEDVGSQDEDLDTLSSPQTRAAAAAAAAGTAVVTHTPAGSAGIGNGLAGLLSPAAVVAQYPQLAGYYKWPGASLVGCLRRFVRSESLGASERWACEKCHSTEHAVKQLSLLELPPVLVLHAKRFEHSGDARATAKKLETFLSFPMEKLDVSGFLSSTILRRRHMLQRSKHEREGISGAISPTSVAGAASKEKPMKRTRSTQSTGSLQPGQQQQQHLPQNDDAEDAPNSQASRKHDMMYDLYGVICHKGTFQGGHYISYVKCADGQWYLCDDAYVAPVEPEVVKNCQAYMLFYAQQSLLGGGA